MNGAWWDGKMPVEHYKHEHSLDTDSIPPSDGDSTNGGPNRSAD
jgi:hypothetical protein